MQKKLHKLTLFLLGIVFLFSPAQSLAFSDVPENHQYYPAIESLENLEIVGGYSDGTFKPSQTVNRAEALKMILNSASADVPEYDGNESIGFTDVSPNAWFTKFLIAGRKKGIVNGNPDGTFAPAREVNKAEFIKMLLETFEIDLSKHQAKTALSIDTTDGQWFLPYLSYSKTVGVISPTLDNKLIPGKQLTRGECAEIIYRMLLIKNGGDAQKMLSIAESHLVDALVELNANNAKNAIGKSNSAVFYTEKAMEAAPDSDTAKGAHKIAMGFRSLCLAYQAGVENNNDEIRNKVNEAKSFANEAKSFGGFETLANKIEEIGNVLIEQIEE